MSMETHGEYFWHERLPNGGDVFGVCGGIIDSHGGLITSLRSELLKTRSEYYPKRIHENGAALLNFIGFIDCKTFQ